MVALYVLEYPARFIAIDLKATYIPQTIIERAIRKGRFSYRAK
jgi:hypothetical protein